MKTKITAVLALSLIVMVAHSDELSQARQEVDTYLELFFDGRNPKYVERAKKYTPFVAAASIKYSVDPLLVAVTISSESSWQPQAVGRFGEAGLGQIHGVARTSYEKEVGHKVKTAQDQVGAMARWLSKCLEACNNDTLRAINRYRSGKCDMRKRGSVLRYRRYLTAVKVIRP